jgi:putative spermidine/putrescine transport system substrate-binding protein
MSRVRNFRPKFSAAAAALATLLAFTWSAKAEDGITFTAWGGMVQDAQKQTWADAFEAKHGIKVLQDGPTDYGKFKAMVDSGNVVWDVVDVEGDFAHQAAAQGLLEPLDYSVIKKDEVDPRFTFDHGVGGYYFSFVLGYNKDVLGDKTPKGWAAMFDTKTYPGKRTLYKWSSPGVLEMALLADGVTPDKLYPLDLDRAFKKLDTIKQDIVWWGSGAQSQQLLASGEASMGSFWNGRVHLVQQTGANVGISWDQNLADADFLVIPKGSKHKEAAMKFIALAVGPKAQADFTVKTSYAPINLKSGALLPEAIQSALPSKYSESQITLDLVYWAKNRDAIGERWYAWQAK